MANLLSLNSSILSSSPSTQLLRRPSIHLTTTTRTRFDPRVRAKIREIFMPALSSTMTEGKIVSWIKSEGDKLSKGDSVVVVESDKADMDVETFYDGFLAKIIVDEGSVAPVGSAIALLAESEAEISDALSKAASLSPNSGPKPAPPPSPSPRRKRGTLLGFDFEVTETASKNILGEMKKKRVEKESEMKAYVNGEKDREITLRLGALTDDEREIILKGCLINYNRA